MGVQPKPRFCPSCPPLCGLTTVPMPLLQAQLPFALSQVCLLVSHLALRWALCQALRTQYWQDRATAFRVWLPPP